jgi:hypothetical protein
MTLTDIALEPPQWLSTVRSAISPFRHRQVTTTAVAHLDDRLRADVGLPPIGDRSPLPHEAAARIAMLACR